MFHDKTWCQLRTHGRALSGSLYTSPEAERLNAAVGGILDQPHVSLYEIGADFGQVFVNKQHSTGVIGIRCLDIPFHHRTKRRFLHILGIIPEEPANMDPFLAPLREELACAGPCGSPGEGFSSCNTP
ncbi:hypothetical protein WJX73_002457 [Symbiochloris irregularis]|uniref:Uncharacterized protein n=1 Tax=Symbiochloris irregularis TaxID=706552 RepID=A0AAW1NQZ6_9CHLO